MQKKALGRGLSALIPDLESTETAQLSVEMERISPNPRQPRRSFDDEQIEELAESIRVKGVIQPLLVRRNEHGYELIAGERRLRASVRAGLKEVPVMVIEVNDSESLQMALIENLQREDLNPMDESRAFLRLQEDFNLGQEQIAMMVGKSRPAVANSMRLASLPAEVQKEVASGRLPAGQARALLGLESESLMLSAAREVLAKGLSTRETERLVGRLKTPKWRKRGGSQLDPSLTPLIEEVQRWLGTKVRLLHRSRSGKGKIEIEYYSTTDFERILRKLMDNQRSPA